MIGEWHVKFWDFVSWAADLLAKTSADTFHEFRAFAHFISWNWIYNNDLILIIFMGNVRYACFSHLGWSALRWVWHHCWHEVILLATFIWKKKPSLIQASWIHFLSKISWTPCILVDNYYNPTDCSCSGHRMSDGLQAATWTTFYSEYNHTWQIQFK